MLQQGIEIYSHKVLKVPFFFLPIHVYIGGGPRREGSGDRGLGASDGTGASAATACHQERGGGHAGHPTGMLVA